MKGWRRRIAAAGLAWLASWVPPGAGPFAGAAESPGHRPPNIVVVIADDLGFSDLGCYGGGIPTPNLDRLAATGVRFSRFYTAARCWQSRTSFLTGFYPQQTRTEPVRWGAPLPGFVRPLPEVLRGLGYRTGFSGKWHVLNPADRALNPHSNFAPVLGFGFEKAFEVRDMDRYFRPKRRLLDDRPLPPASGEAAGSGETEIVDRAIDFLDGWSRRDPRSPVFLLVAFRLPHFPLMAPETTIERFGGAFDEGWDAVAERRRRKSAALGIAEVDRYVRRREAKVPWSLDAREAAALLGPGEVVENLPWDRLTETERRFQSRKMEIHAAKVHLLDREVGRLVARLKESGRWERTWLFFFSDNGASTEILVRGDGHDPAKRPGSAGTYLSLGPGWGSTANAPLRGAKAQLYEGGISSPLIVRAPADAAIKEGAIVGRPAHIVDLFPTLVALAGGADRGGGAAAGGERRPGASLLPALEGNPSAGGRTLFFRHGEDRAVCSGDWKAVSTGGRPWELFDLADDRGENFDLANSEPDVVRRLEEKWREHAGKSRRMRGGTGDPAR
jgi:arylsulfatase